MAELLFAAVGSNKLRRERMIEVNSVLFLGSEIHTAELSFRVKPFDF